jgi:hypothetical protein
MDGLTIAEEKREDIAFQFGRAVARRMLASPAADGVTVAIAAHVCAAHVADLMLAVVGTVLDPGAYDEFVDVLQAKFVALDEAA